MCDVQVAEIPHLGHAFCLELDGACKIIWPPTSCCSWEAVAGVAGGLSMSSNQRACGSQDQKCGFPNQDDATSMELSGNVTEEKAGKGRRKFLRFSFLWHTLPLVPEVPNSHTFSLRGSVRNHIWKVHLPQSLPPPPGSACRTWMFHLAWLGYAWL